MKAFISLKDLEFLVSAAARKEALYINEIEVSDFVMGLLTSIGSIVIKIAIAQTKEPQEGSISVSVLSLRAGALFGFVFDFDNLRRAQLILDLVVSSGLAYGTCDLVLRAIEDVVQKRLAEGDEVEIEGIGTFKLLDGEPPYRVFKRTTILTLSSHSAINRK